MNKNIQIRNTFSGLETLTGLGLFAYGMYWLWLARSCPELAHDCVGWTVLTAAAFYVPGFLIAIAGAISLFWKKQSLAVIQATLVVVLLGLYMWFIT